MKNITRCILIAVLFFVELPMLSGCTKDPYMLGITGYNYTDRAVSDFAVNGAAGSNVELSSPTAGGGKMSCCVVLGRDTKTPFWIDVEYKMDALESYPPRKMIEPSGPYVKTRVKVDDPIPSDPRYLEIHFYPDHIEAAISGADGPSPPRLKLVRRLPYVR